MGREKPHRVDLPLRRVLLRIDPEQRLRVYRLWSFWADEVGSDIAAHSHPVSVRGGVLTVAVNSHAWMQELHFLKDALRDRLNARLGDALIEDIYLIHGEVPRRDPSTIAGHNDRTPPPIPPLRDSALTAVFNRLAHTHARRGRR